MSYNPSFATLTNKPLGIAQGVPTDGRSYFYDEALFLWRPYQSTSEVTSYLNLTKYRKGNFPIFVNATGTLQSDGSFVGGKVEEYSFKNDTTTLVLKVNTAADILGIVRTDTQQDITNLSVWDFSLGEWAIVTGNANKSYTISNMPTPGGGAMHFTQDATGSRTLTINGVSIPVLSTGTTRIDVLIIGSTITYNTSNGSYVSGLVTLQQLSTPVLVGGTATLTTVPLSWAGIANNAGYEIQRSIDNTVWVTGLNAPANTLSYLFSPLTPGTTWYFRIRAVGDNSSFVSSNWSNVVTKTTVGSSTMLLADDFEDNRKDTSKWIYVDINGFLIETLAGLHFTPTGGVISGVDYTTTNNSMASQGQFVDSFLALRFDLQVGVAEQFRIGLYTSGFGSFAVGGLQIVTTSGVGVLLIANYNAGPSAATSFTTTFSNTDSVNRSYKITINKTTQVGKVYWWSSGAWVQLGSNFTTFQTPDRVCISVARASTNVGENIVDNVMLNNADFTTLNP